MKFHHVGIIVQSINNSLKEFTPFIKFEKTTIPVNISSQKVNVCFLQLGEFNLELIEPAAENSPVTDFASKGGGIHHLCFEVDDIHEELEQMKKDGATIIVEPVKGFEDRLIASVFLNMKNTNCNLIELATRNPTI